MKKARSIDTQLLIMTIVLVIVGYIIFSSASLGVLARDQSDYASLTFKQAIVGIVGGGVAMLILMSIPLAYIRRYALHFLIFAIFLNALIFVPGLSTTQGGAARWLALGAFSFQPSEVLKFAAIIYYAAWIASRSKNIKTLKGGFVPLLIMSACIEGIVLAQRNTDPVIIAAFVAMFFVAGGKLRHIALLILIGLVGFVALAFYRPYIEARIMTFLNPSANSQTSSYQLQQSLIAVGTGGLLGRGYGQSIQKFNYLPEAVSDSIFAVEAEEFGFAGSVVLIILFLLFTMRALKVASTSRDLFGAMVVVGFIMVMIGESFMNIGAMIGVLPLTGVPLLFVSQGGTSMLVGLAEVGIILNISRYKK